MKNVVVPEFVYRIDTLARWFFQISLVIFVVGLLLGHSIDSDTWWHLADGRWMADNQQIIHYDSFSYTRPGAIWAHPGYLWEIAIYDVYTGFSYPGVDILAGLTISAIFIILWNTLKTKTVIQRFILVMAAIIISAVYWSARPNIFTLLFAVLTIFVLEKHQSGNRWILFVMPVMVAIWANLHGGFFISFVLLGLYILDNLKDRQRLMRFLMVIPLMAIASLINPYGLDMYREMLMSVSRTAEQSLINEWQSPNFHSVYGLIFLAGIAISFILLALRRKPVKLSRLLLPIVFIVVGLISARNIALFGVLAPYAWISYLGWEKDEGSPQTPRSPAPAATGVSFAFGIYSIFALVVNMNSVIQTPPYYAEQPVQSILYIQSARPPGNLFNNYNWGGFIIWMLPQYKVFVDGRDIVYGDQIILASDAIERALPGWDLTLDRWKINTVLTENGSALGQALIDHQWSLCHSDPVSSVFIRNGPCPVTAK